MYKNAIRILTAVSRTTWLSWYQKVKPSWIFQQTEVTELAVVITRAIRCAKLWSNHYCQTQCTIKL